MAAAEVERLQSIVEPLVVGSGFDLEQIVVTHAGKRSQVRVLIDSDNGVDMDAAAQVSRLISAELDELTGSDDPMGQQPYTFEVSSPGIGRPLTLPRHFRRAAGRLISLRVGDGAPREVRILTADDTTVTVLLGPTSIKTEVIDIGQIGKATVEVEFNSPPAAVRELLAAVGADRTAQDSRVDLTADSESDDDDDDAEDEDEELDR